MPRKAKSIKNCLAPINQLPSRSFRRNAVWSMPSRSVDAGERYCCCFLDWRNTGGSSSEIQLYIDQSKSTLVDVTLSFPELAELVVPHVSRLVSLTLRLDNSHSLSQIVKHLDYPIPTSHILHIVTDGPGLYASEFSSVLQTPPFTLEGAGNQVNLGVGWTPNLPSRHRGYHTHEGIHFEANGLPLEYIGTISDAREGLHHIRCRFVH